MWPWEHLAFAYVLYSLTTNVILRRSPTARETVAVAVGSQLPDLIDKPLAWTFGITETGYSIGHSIILAPVIYLAVYAVAARWGYRSLAGALSLAHLSHSAGDILNRILRGDPVDIRILLWPIASPPAGTRDGFVDHVLRYFLRYVYLLLVEGLTVQILVQLLLGIGMVVLWVFDGAPIATDLWRLVSTRRQQ
ncbi:metal-dependent hydrolase [Natrinema marinum]|uniref:metal-dependent hydrolase n=1 Tax=Natrinema marinum TaxID=2961598 RepID=UPI0020C85C7C|nr:metal-dependent hydrolase [Natrinema marinum]